MRIKTAPDKECRDRLGYASSQGHGTKGRALVWPGNIVRTAPLF
jgi:hypothetical protein